MLINFQGIFDHKERFQLFKENRVEMLWLSPRVNYIRENEERAVTRMSLIKCRNGLQTLEDIEAASLSGKWVNSESREVLRTVGIYLDNHDTEIAYRLESAGRYFAIQTVSDGYDYTFYDNQFRELDGGVYDNPDVTLSEAMEDILGDEGLSVADCKVMDFEELQEKANEAEQEKNRKPLTAESGTGLTVREPPFCRRQSTMPETGKEYRVSVNCLWRHRGFCMRNNMRT